MADAVTPITTHAADAKARLLQQFKDKANIEALLDAINVEVQRYEDEVMDLSDVLDIDLMGGVNLDNIGKIVGQPREGRSDADYRVAIRAKIGVNYSSGTPDEVIASFERITGSTDVTYAEDYPAGLWIYGDAPTYPDDILDQIDALAPASVYIGIMVRMLQEGTSEFILIEGTTDKILLRYRSTGR